MSYQSNSEYVQSHHKSACVLRWHRARQHSIVRRPCFYGTEDIMLLATEHERSTVWIGGILRLMRNRHAPCGRQRLEATALKKEKMKMPAIHSLPSPPSLSSVSQRWRAYRAVWSRVSYDLAVLLLMLAGCCLVAFLRVLVWGQGSRRLDSFSFVSDTDPCIPSSHWLLARKERKKQFDLLAVPAVVCQQNRFEAAGWTFMSPHETGGRPRTRLTLRTTE